MSDDERQRWDERYASGEYRPRTEASPFVLGWLDHVPRGPALDVATGTGRNAMALAEAGFDVDAVDISAVAIDRGREEAERRGLAISWHVADLDTDPLPRDGYSLVVVSRYRNRALWPRLATALAPDGWVLIEHHLRTHRDVGGPPSDDFRLEPGELLEAFAGLRIVYYREVVEPADHGDGLFANARLAACAGDPGF